MHGRRRGNKLPDIINPSPLPSCCVVVVPARLCRPNLALTPSPPLTSTHLAPRFSAIPSSSSSLANHYCHMASHSNGAVSKTSAPLVIGWLCSRAGRCNCISCLDGKDPRREMGALSLPPPCSLYTLGLLSQICNSMASRADTSKCEPMTPVESYFSLFPPIGWIAAARRSMCDRRLHCDEPCLGASPQNVQPLSSPCFDSGLSPVSWMDIALGGTSYTDRGVSYLSSGTIASIQVFEIADRNVCKFPISSSGGKYLR